MVGFLWAVINQGRLKLQGQSKNEAKNTQKWAILTFVFQIFKNFNKIQLRSLLFSTEVTPPLCFPVFYVKNDNIF